MSLRLTKSEAWTLASFLTTSKDQDLLLLGCRLEQQLRDIEEARKEFEKALVLMGTGYMCTACGMPVEAGSISSCCSAPVIDTD